MKAHHAGRDNIGRYQARLDRVCKCGHTLGEHTASRVRDSATGKTYQECLADDCACVCFKRKA